MSTFLHVIGLVRAPRVSQSRGPQRDRPPADCSYPGLAWHMGTWSMAHLTYQLLPVQARVLLRVATVPPPAPTVGPGPPSTTPFLPLPPPVLFLVPPSVHDPIPPPPSARPVPCLTLRPRPHSSPSHCPPCSLSHSRSTTYASSSLCPPYPLSHPPPRSCSRCCDAQAADLSSALLVDPQWEVKVGGVFYLLRPSCRPGG